MNGDSRAQTRSSSAPPLLIWWVIWGAILSGLVVIYAFLGQRPTGAQTETTAVIDYIGVGPLVLSSLIRWWWFPRIERGTQALPIFIAGIALAEGSGIIGIFLSVHATEMFVFGVLGILQWMPLFAGKYPSSPPGGRARPSE